jgi:hypothetical protein
MGLAGCTRSIPALLLSPKNSQTETVRLPGRGGLRHSPARLPDEGGSSTMLDQNSATKVIPIAIRKDANHARAVILSDRKSADAAAISKGLTPSNAKRRFSSKKCIKCNQRKNQAAIAATPIAYRTARTDILAGGRRSDPEANFKQTSPDASASWDRIRIASVDKLIIAFFSCIAVVGALLATSERCKLGRCEQRPYRALARAMSDVVYSTCESPSRTIPAKINSIPKSRPMGMVSCNTSQHAHGTRI